MPNYRVEPLQVHNPQASFEISSMGITPGHFLREYVQNAIEAGATKCTIRSTPENKLQIIDNGCGMIGDDLVQWMGNLFSGAKGQSATGNFGIGAKISAIGRNKGMGITYTSWVKGNPVGAEVVFIYDEETGQYGLQLFDVDGTDESGNKFADVASCVVTDMKKPSLIKHSGTVVTFNGNFEDDATIAVPDGLKGGSTKWIHSVLNGRYFKFKGKFKLSAERWEDGAQTSNRRPSMVPGAERRLDDHIARYSGGKSGTLKVTPKGLPSATIRWWLAGDRAVDMHSSMSQKIPFVSFMNKNELYDYDSSAKTMRGFGVAYVLRRLAVIIEPDEKRIQTNQERTHLMLNSGGKELASDVLEDYQQEFTKNLPKAIKDAEAKSIKDNITEAFGGGELKKYLKTKMNALPPPPVLMRSYTGTVAGTTNTTTGVGNPTNQTSVKKTPSSQPTTSKGGGRQSTGDSGSTGMRMDWFDAPEEEEGRAGNYAPSSQLISLYKSYYLYQTIKDVLLDTYPFLSEYPKDLDAAVLRAAGKRIAMSVSCIRRLKSQPTWTPQIASAAMSPEALTALMEGSRNDILGDARRSLASKFTGMINL